MYTPKFQNAYDIQSTVIYVGTSGTGVATSEASWKIKKVVLDASGNPTSTKFAGDGLFTQVWDNRTSLSYT